MHSQRCYGVHERGSVQFCFFDSCATESLHRFLTSLLTPSLDTEIKMHIVAEEIIVAGGIVKGPEGSGAGAANEMEVDS